MDFAQYLEHEGTPKHLLSCSSVKVLCNHGITSSTLSGSHGLIQESNVYSVSERAKVKPFKGD